MANKKATFTLDMCIGSWHMAAMIEKEADAEKGASRLGGGRGDRDDGGRNDRAGDGARDYRFRPGRYLLDRRPADGGYGPGSPGIR